MSESSLLTTLIVGSGGREHVLARASSLSPLVGRTLAAPGNPGMEACAECVTLSVDDIEGIVSLAKKENVDLVIVGPEAPLCAGIVDALAEQGILAYGPKADGARLEGSKVYAKEILIKNNIPTGAAANFDNAKDAIEYLSTASFPIVIKADGLAAGKGVIIAEDHDIAEKTIRDMIEGGAFGDAGAKLLIEECLFGEETSIHVIISGNDYLKGYVVTFGEITGLLQFGHLQTR